MKIIYVIVATLVIQCCAAFFNDAESQNTVVKREINKWELKRVKTGDVYPAKVPGCVHTDLLDNKKIEEPFYRTNEKKLQWIDKEDWIYQSVFTVGKKTVDMDYTGLYFKGLDTYADVYLNDSLVLKADNMFREWKIPVKGLLKAGENKIRIYFHSPVKLGLEKLAQQGYALPAPNDQSENGEMGEKKVSPFTRKAPYHYGWDWGPRFVTSGIWRPVFIEAWNKARVNEVQYVQNKVDKENANITVNVEYEALNNANGQISVIDAGSNKILAASKVQINKGKNTASLTFDLPNPKLWWTNGLGTPNLYRFKTVLTLGKSKHDSIETSIGIRSLKVIRKKDEIGESFYFELNGVPVFAKGANHIPNDIFISRVTPAVYKREVDDAVAANINMLRVWGGGIYEDDAFYTLCDKAGIMLWQDFMFACSMYPGDEAFLASVKAEAIDNVKRLRNHPSIAIWCGNNEIESAWGPGDENSGWGWKPKYTTEQRKQIWDAYESLFHKLLPEVIAQYDPERTYWPSSPHETQKRDANNNVTSGDMHYWGVWHAKEPFSRFNEVKSRFMSEYGFQSFPDMVTIRKYTQPEDYNIESEVMSSHQRSGIGNVRIREYMGDHYNIPAKFESLIYLAQVLQAEGIKSAIEAHRGQRPYCMGSLYWQINDCWPVASWSGIDYYGRWKALHYFVKKSFKNVIIVPSVKDSVVNILAISDLTKELNGTLSLELIDFEGKSLWKPEPLKVSVPVNSNKNIFSKNLADLPLFDKEKVVLKATLSYDDQHSTLLHYFNPVKKLLLPKPAIQKAVIKTKEGYKVTLTSSNLVKNVYVSVDGDEGQFSDNYFDLVPGETVELTYKSAKQIPDFLNKIKTISIAELK